MADHEPSTEDPRDLVDSSADGSTTDDLVTEMQRHFDGAREKLADSRAALLNWIEATKSRFEEDLAAQQPTEASAPRGSSTITELREAVQNLDGADSQAELLSRLLEQSRRFSGRVALLLGSGPEAGEHDAKSLKIWNASGFEDAVDGRTVPCPKHWDPVLSAETTLLLTGPEAPVLSALLDCPAPSQSLAVPFILRDSAYAILYTDDFFEDGTEDPAEFAVDALQLLCFVASQSMECLTLRSVRPCATLVAASTLESSDEAAAEEDAGKIEPYTDSQDYLASDGEDGEPTSSDEDSQSPPESAEDALSKSDAWVISEEAQPSEDPEGSSEDTPDPPPAASWSLTPEPEAEVAPPEEAPEAEDLSSLHSTSDLPPAPVSFEPTAPTGWDADQATSFVSAIEDSEPAKPPQPPPPSFLAPPMEADVPPLPTAIESAPEEEPEDEEEQSAEIAQESLSTDSGPFDDPSLDQDPLDSSGESGEVSPIEPPISTPSEPEEPEFSVVSEVGPAIPPPPIAPDQPSQDPAATQVVDSQRMSPPPVTKPGLGSTSLGSTEPPRPGVFDSLEAGPPVATSTPPVVPSAEPTPPTPITTQPEKQAAAPSPERREGPRPPSSSEVKAPADLDGPGMAFKHQVPEGEDPRVDEARRLARLLVSELKLYNEEEITRGRRLGNIYQSLREDIDRSRRIYDERIDQNVRDAGDFLHEELVKGLANGDPTLLGL